VGGDSRETLRKRLRQGLFLKSRPVNLGRCFPPPTNRAEWGCSPPVLWIMLRPSPRNVERMFASIRACGWCRGQDGLEPVGPIRVGNLVLIQTRSAWAGCCFVFRRMGARLRAGARKIHQDHPVRLTQRSISALPYLILGARSMTMAGKFTDFRARCSPPLALFRTFNPKRQDVFWRPLPLPCISW